MNKKLKYGVFALIVIGLLTLLVTYVGQQNVPLLMPRGSVGLRERNLIYFALGLSLVVIVPVFSLLFAITWKYRESNTKAKYSPEVNGSRKLETVWWLIPGALILVLSIVTWFSSHSLDPYRPVDAKSPTLTIQVVALDWKWLFIYPQQHIASVNYVAMPTNTNVDFQITADAPMNSFWIPQLGGQIYAMPGMSTDLHLEADKPGDYRGQSANISGRGFAGMVFKAHATSLEGFDTWAANVAKRHTMLNQTTYDALAKPSTNNPVTTYAAVDPNLYAATVMKYMSPTGAGGVQ